MSRRDLLLFEIIFKFFALDLQSKKAQNWFNLNFSYYIVVKMLSTRIIWLILCIFSVNWCFSCSLLLIKNTDFKISVHKYTAIWLLALVAVYYVIMQDM